MNQYIVLKSIVYKNPASPAYGRVISPKDNLILTFPHLNAEDLVNLIDSGTIVKISTKEAKDLEAKRTQMEIDCQTELDRKSAAYLAQKKQALEKMKNAL